MGERPIRVQLSRRKGWRMPENTVRVARPGRWGNPYVAWKDVGQWYVSSGSCHWPLAENTKQAAAALAVEKFREVITSDIAILTIRHELAGKNLACWCPLDQPCHADLLLEIANAEARPNG